MKNITSIIFTACTSALLLPLFAAAAEPPPTDVVLIEQGKVANAFAVGQPLLANSSFKILAGRRVVPGIPEVHDQDTDIFYIVEGTATFVTGGSVVEPTPSSPGETRGKSLSGGTTRHLSKGDVIVIPAGVPHQFTEVGGTFLYYVVKVTR